MRVLPSQNSVFLLVRLCICLVLTIYLGIQNTLFAQDIHFSQFNTAPLNINPANTGQFDGRYRFMANQRTQWRSVTVPYSTFGLAADMSSLQYSIKSEEGKQIKKVENLGLGFVFVNDKTGDSHFQTTVFNLAGSYKFQISEHDVIVPGILTGLTLRKIDYSELNYDNQWNGYFFDPSVSPGEFFNRDSYTNFNFQVGLLWTHDWTNKKLNTGFGLYHLNIPGQSFFEEQSIRLDPRINFHSTMLIELNSTWSVEPSLLLMKQGKYSEFDLGGLGYYRLPSAPFENHQLFGGFFFRTKDAGFLVAGVQYDAWRGGISYDFNLSNLRPASHGRGGFEFSLMYIIDWPPSVTNFKKYCPDFM